MIPTYRSMYYQLNYSYIYHPASDILRLTLKLLEFLLILTEDRSNSS
jgi:hypothetical protein